MFYAPLLVSSSVLLIDRSKALIGSWCVSLFACQGHRMHVSRSRLLQIKLTFDKKRRLGRARLLKINPAQHSGTESSDRIRELLYVGRAIRHRQTLLCFFEPVTLENHTFRLCHWTKMRCSEAKPVSFLKAICRSCFATGHAQERK